ncbi:histidine ammonia-lyase [Vicingaceae bacterium]|nr:histidine ammonia-lyase [Vicingaceae bacterium]
MLTVSPGNLSLEQIRISLENDTRIQLDPDCLDGIVQAQDAVKQVIDQHQTVYGINTGFGLLANTRISDSDLSQLQLNIVRSHAAGTGKPMPPGVVRLAILLKVNSLARGYSGVRPVVIDTLIEVYNSGAVPIVPEKGSVGASGDLAPLAHLSCCLIGEGSMLIDGKTVPSADALRQLGIRPVELGPKEGLALLNGTQISTALALCNLLLAEKVFSAAIIAGGMSVDAARGSSVPFDNRIQTIRNHRGQIDVARCFRELMEGSEILESHVDCDRVQDPYSLRCQPQVMGACLEQIRFVADVLSRESNAVSDNPLVFADTGEILSGGNFHAEPVAMAADNLAIAIAEIGSLSERRIALLIDTHLSELPPFLVNNSGLNSGFMLAQVTAAAVASENKSLAHPASVDSLPTSANQEDHVSMATFAARRLGEMNDNTATIVAIEMLAAAQGIDFRSPKKTSPRLQKSYIIVRSAVPNYESDRLFAPDIEAIKQLVLSGAFKLDDGVFG